MPQSTKDSQGGKTHAKKKSNPGGTATDASAKKSQSRATKSPVGPSKHGEKKTTPG